MFIHFLTKKHLKKNIFDLKVVSKVPQRDGLILLVSRQQQLINGSILAAIPAADFRAMAAENWLLVVVNLLPSGKRLQFANLEIAIEIVDFPYFPIK